MEELFSEKETDQEGRELQIPDYSALITGLIRSTESPRALKKKLEDFHDNDIAEVLPQLTDQERLKLYRILSVDSLSDIFSYLEPVSVYLDEVDIKKAVDIVSHMDADVAVEALRGIEKTKRKLMIELLDADFQKEIALIASFDEDEIGSRMTTNYISISDDLTVKQAMSELVRQAAENDNISTIYVLDDQKVFSGAIDLKDLIIAREGTKLDDLVITSFPYVYGTENIDDCIERLKDYSEASIPVLDNDNHLLGVITSQDIIEVVDDEMGEDYARLAGLTAEEDLAEPLHDSIRKRIPWLIILLALGMLVSTVVSVFETVVAQLTILMTFQSLILDMAGNVGTQSLAVTIRVLMDEMLTPKQKLSLVWKEVKVGFCNGLLLGSASCLLIGLFIWLIKGRGLGFGFAVSACIGLALLIAMIMSSFMGTVIPLFFKKIGVDPAVASGPLITTVNDLVAVLTYYGLSWLFLIQIFHFHS